MPDDLKNAIDGIESSEKKTAVPEDELITKFDLEGRALVKIPEDSVSFQEIADNIEKLLEI